ncbi:hypothetical protein V501_02659 [Pseudogymnoascus sp. VKM F-4519 (FW-2642)]|nr:hypothetical protein V501_02659 [Pseudogymnoascus sp. VKM F-4519 (FW-2642)]
MLPQTYSASVVTWWQLPPDQQTGTFAAVFTKAAESGHPPGLRDITLKLLLSPNGNSENQKKTRTGRKTHRPTPAKNLPPPTVSTVEAASSLSAPRDCLAVIITAAHDPS